MTPTIATGIDLPTGAAGGSVELFADLYTAPGAPLKAWAFMLGAGGPAAPGGPVLLDGEGKCAETAAFWDYTRRLAEQIRDRTPAPDVLHLHHLAFGATPALLEAFPHVPGIALVHGTDLLFAETSPTQRRVLTRTAARAQVIVAPTTAMADRLVRLAPHTARPRIVHLPWGVPDHLIDSPPPRPAGDDGAPLRLLYAGRYSPEKGVDELIEACSHTGAHLTLATPTAPPLPDGVRHRGWLPRRALWDEFAHHDLLVVPSAAFEAFGLVAIEAQACGLPVLYRQVPGLDEVLGGSAVALPGLEPRAMASAVSWLHRERAVLDLVRESGRRNAARYRLSHTAAALADLTTRTACGR